MSLSGHIITEVKAGEVRNRFPRLIGKNARLPEHGYGYSARVVVIKTNTGYTGWGVGYADKTLKLLLEGKRVSDVFAPEIGILDQGYVAADIALHDLAGKILGIPVSKMINPNSQMKTKCYDGAIYFNDLSPKEDLGVERIVQDCIEDSKLGYNAFKVKVGRGNMWLGKEEGLKRDIDIVSAINKEFPNAEILVDFNDGADLESIKVFMESLPECNIYWIEEPFLESYDNCMQLREYLNKTSPNTLIADGEFDYCPEHVISLAENGAIDVMLMDVLSYGFTAWRTLLKKCEKTGVKCSPHAWGYKLKTHIIAHLAAAFPTICPTIEGVIDTAEGVDYSGYVMNNGILSIPQRSGFGMDVEFVRPYNI